MASSDDTKAEQGGSVAANRYLRRAVDKCLGDGIDPEQVTEALLRMAALGALPLALLAAAAHALHGRAVAAGGRLTRALAVVALCLLYGALVWGVAKALPLIAW